MKHKHLLPAVAAMAIVALAGCKKTDSNPPVEDLASVPFEFALEEVRQLKTFRWWAPDGILTNDEETIHELYVTEYNEVTVMATASVNASSEQPDVVAIERTGEGKDTFRLLFKGEGKTTIHLWNGTEGANRNHRQFQVTGRAFVDLQGVRFEYAGQPLLITHYMEKRPLLLITSEDGKAGNEDNPARMLSQGDILLKPYVKPDIWSEEKRTFITNPDQGALLKFVGLEPENASFRTITAFESEWDVNWKQMSKRLIAWGIIEEGEYPDWPCLSNCHVDVSYFVEERPAQIWIACVYDSPYYLASIKVPVADGKTRYYYLYHAPEP